ncbi:hypothetical protein HYH03_014975 [Edaphochlamys debaryana]|uniref:peptidylprolyl isomerase n=1 Tax=Edaphochlamys debaryana TaxID=47281 RepID=A0A835XP68_9CHLO|nr:hypothetical protein HYH03_014975 [Edaphochlamys debaryana]|eukprot:KAG2486398.1 hypothetical protein HYH03_014975 [Edaphochlamys debaryana]
MLAYKQHVLHSSSRRPAGAIAPAVSSRRSSVLPQAPAQLATARPLAASPAPCAGPAASRRALRVCAAAAKGEKALGPLNVAVAVEELSAIRRVARVTVPAAAVKEVFKRGVKRAERDVIGQLRGWQAGKPLPLSMVITQLGGQDKFKAYCLEELLLAALPEAVDKARAGKAVDPASVEIPPSEFPAMLAAYDPAKDFAFTAQYEVAPPLAWRTPLDEISVTIKDSGDFATDAAAADDLIRQFRKQHGFSRVVASRGLQLGDTLVMDLQVTNKSTGQALPGLTHSRFSFDTEKDVLGITQGMLGMKAGESRSFTHTLPEDYDVEFWQGLPVQVAVKVHEMFEWTLPEFDDAYVAQHHAGQWTGAKEMREALIAQTAIKRVSELDKQLEDAVVKAVADAVDVPEVSPRMVEALGERQFQAQLLQMIEDRIGSREDVEKLATEEMAAEFIRERRKDLEDQVKFNLAVDEIFASRGLALDEEAVKAEAELRIRQMQVLEASKLVYPQYWWGELGLDGKRVAPTPADVEASVKQQLSQAAEAVLVDLSRRFPPVKVLEASKLVYPQYWWGELGLDGKRVAPTPADVEAKLATLKEYYGVSKPAPSISGFAGAGPSNGEQLTPLLDFEKLFEQRALFASEAPEQATIVMDAAANGAKLPKGTFVAFWQSMTQSRWVADGCSEYVRLAKLVATIVPGSVEAERLFSTMSYIKDSQRNKLQQRHLALAMVGTEFDREELMEDVRETVKSVTVIEWLKDNVRRVVIPYNGTEADAVSTGQEGGRQPVAA